MTTHQNAAKTQSESPHPHRPLAQSQLGSKEFTDKLNALIVEAGGQEDHPNNRFVRELMVTALKLVTDERDRGELKLMSAAMRELRHAYRVFARHPHLKKISIFGSARTATDHPDYQAAIEFSREMASRDWAVITGAGDGIMKAGHGGAGREKSFGVAIRLPFEQSTNVIIADDDKLVNFKYFFTRKLMFIKEASAVVLFPGGFGTQDEGFEALTLVQTGKANMVPIVLIDAPGGTYWQHWRTYVSAELLRTGMIGPDSTSPGVWSGAGAACGWTKLD